ncbi:hypothetical protein BJY00DRAFT_265147 [Aspergillus carlsbadensis]|nr:hypothetical protein BJY00DRAFT_265147 [Aspergillus carlsbadensis]
MMMAIQYCSVPVLSATAFVMLASTARPLFSNQRASWLRSPTKFHYLPSRRDFRPVFFHPTSFIVIIHACSD